MSAQPESDQETKSGAGNSAPQHTRGPGATSITPSQRAAVIITVLGESAAKPIVEKLDDHALAKVAEAMADISFIAREELVEIVVDFLSHLRRSAGALRGGKSKAQELITSLVDSKRLGLVLDQGNPGEVPGVNQSQNVWARLEQKQPQQIAEYLNGLTPNIIALILRKLDVSISSDVLCHLNEDKLVPMMGYMVESEQLDPGIDMVIGRMLEMEFLNIEQAASEDANEHLEAIGELLSLIPSDKRESLVSFLSSEHETKLQTIQGALFTIEGLPDMLPRASVPVVFRELDADTMLNLLASLQAQYAPVVEYLLGNISSRLADQLREELNDAKSVSPADAETMHRDFLAALMGLKRRELITLEKPAAAES
ncbi:MAG: FliG C-terminal domain-containing protein [Hyphomonadaceae bacterium]